MVAYDDLDLPFGRLRIRCGGSAGGHRGLASILQYVADRDFVRLRIGVGHPGRRGMIGFLTGKKLGKRDRARVEASLEMDDALLALLVDGELDKAMSRFHARKSTAE